MSELQTMQQDGKHNQIGQPIDQLTASIDTLDAPDRAGLPDEPARPPAPPAKSGAAPCRNGTALDDDSAVLGLVGAITDAYLLVNRRGRILDANMPALELFGWQRSELIGAPIEVLVPKRFHSMHIKEFGRYFDEQNPRAMCGAAVTGVTRAGEEIQASVTLHSLGDGARRFVLAIVRPANVGRRDSNLLQRRFAEVCSLRLIDAAIVRGADLHLVLSLILEQIAARCGILAATVWTWDNPGDLPAPAMVWGLQQILRGEDQLDDRARWVAEAVQCGGAGADSARSRCLTASMRTLSDSNVCCLAPISAHGCAVGAIETAWPRAAEPDEASLRFVEELGHRAALCIARSTELNGLRRSTSELRQTLDDAVAFICSTLQVSLQEAERLVGAARASRPHLLKDRDGLRVERKEAMDGTEPDGRTE
jgi:PAS domain S-box-containing protein